jgi:CelD/BcsL family acetyltransferase involved in cellulose biosynthesis
VTPPAVSVTPLRTEEEWSALADSWNGLLARSGADTVFLTWEWLHSWWRAYGAGRELSILRVDRDGRPVGLAPLYRTTAFPLGRIPFASLALVGDGSHDSDYLDWICATGEEEPVVRALCDHLHRREGKWSLLLMNEIPGASPALPHLERHARGRGWLWHAVPVACAEARLPATWDEFLRSLRPRMRTKVRAVTREMEERHGARYERCERLEDLEPRLESLYDLHGQRWGAAGKRGVFVSPEKRAFYSDVSRRFFARGWLRFDSLRVGERYVAHQFCFEYSGTMYLLQEGMDPAWFEHGAGNALRAHVFRDCIERGVRTYDFLGGVTPHKLSWGASEKTSWRITTGPASARNGLLFGYRAARALAARVLRRDGRGRAA